MESIGHAPSNSNSIEPLETFPITNSQTAITIITHNNDNVTYLASSNIVRAEWKVLYLYEIYRYVTKYKMH